jgi:hypothetical protein
MAPAGPDAPLASRKEVSRLKRPRTQPGTSATVAAGSVQKKATQQCGPRTSTTRIRPPSRQAAGDMLYASAVGLPHGRIRRQPALVRDGCGPPPARRQSGPRISPSLSARSYEHLFKLLPLATGRLLMSLDTACSSVKKMVFIVPSVMLAG